MRLELVIVAAAYLLGSIPFAYLVVRLRTGQDVRKTGSGNVGATNALRAAGLLPALAVAVLDIAKGVVPVLVMRHFNPAGGWEGAAAVAAVTGHCFPVWLRFRGGKGVATAAGAFVTLAPVAAACAAAVWIVMLGMWRTVSLGSVVAVASFPLWLAFVQRASSPLVIAGSIVSMIIILRHHRNIRRLVAGKEPRLGEKHPGDGRDR